jgi:hypothetical protein
MVGEVKFYHGLIDNNTVSDKMLIRSLEVRGPQVRGGLREVRTASQPLRPPRFIPVISSPEQRPEITELRDPEFSVIVRQHDLPHSLIIARGLACLTDRLLGVSGLTGAMRFIIDYGRDVLRSTANISKGEIILNQFVLRRFHDLSTMSPEQRRQYDIDSNHGLFETDLDEINVAFVIGHEIAHLKQYTGIFGFFNKLLRFFGPYNRRLEYRADKLAADYLLQLGYRDPIRAFQQAMRLFEDIKKKGRIRDWFLRTHPTFEQRRSRMEEYLRNRPPAAPRYAGESFEELSQLDSL